MENKIVEAVPDFVLLGEFVRQFYYLSVRIPRTSKDFVN